MMTITSNLTQLSVSTSNQRLLSSSYMNIIKRFLIVFGSICILWLIIGLIFAFIQTYIYLRKRTKRKLFHSNLLVQPSSLLTPIGQTIKQDNISDHDYDDDDDDDQTSISTSVSYLSQRSKILNEQTHYISQCQRIPEEEYEYDLNLPTSSGIINMTYSQSTLASSNDCGPSMLYYPACRNFAYSQSTLASSSADLNTPTPSVIIQPTNTILPASKCSSMNRINLKRHSSQSSATTTLSQITNATYLSSSNTSTYSSIRPTSIKTMPLPTVMITDCDRLQTDIIELEDFEPEKDWSRSRSQLRLLLNDKMPQAVR